MAVWALLPAEAPTMRSHDRTVLRLLLAGLSVASAFVGCSAANQAASTRGTGGTGGMGGGAGAGASPPDGGDDGPSLLGDAGNHCPSTCAELDAGCGAVTDTKCGGVVQCGGCPAGETCGGGGTHNVCATGANPDACAPMTCQQQGVLCGPAGDGCNGMLQCGTCVPPQTCGGDPSKPGQCGCTGLCAQIPTCPSSATTTITGTVYDPAAVHPLYNALVYIPNDPSDPGLQPFPAGITCDQCGASAAGNPLVSTYTAPDGTFTLSNVPVGATIPLVVQLGRWRRQLTVNVASACASNAVPDKTLTMPKSQTEGDIPRIALLTGGFDPVECVLRKIGVQDGEFTNPGGGGRINFYLADEGSSPIPGLTGHGAAINAQTPNQAALFAMSGGSPVINQYDMVIVECEGYPQGESTSDLAALRTYAESGGRLFASDYAYTWLYQNGNFSQAAAWHVDQDGNGSTAAPVNIDLVNNPKGMAFDQWLEIVGISAPGSHTIASIFPAFHNTDGVVSPTQQWLYWMGQAPMHFTYNTPVGAPSTQQCGRVVYSDWHAESNVIRPRRHLPRRVPRRPDDRAGGDPRVHALRPLRLRAALHPGVHAEDVRGRGHPVRPGRRRLRQPARLRHVPDGSVLRRRGPWQVRELLQLHAFHVRDAGHPVRPGGRRLRRPARLRQLPDRRDLRRRRAWQVRQGPVRVTAAGGCYRPSRIAAKPRNRCSRSSRPWSEATRGRPRVAQPRPRVAQSLPSPRRILSPADETPRRAAQHRPRGREDRARAAKTVLRRWGEPPGSTQRRKGRGRRKPSLPFCASAPLRLCVPSSFFSTSARSPTPPRAAPAPSPRPASRPPRRRAARRWT